MTLSSVGPSLSCLCWGETFLTLRVQGEVGWNPTPVFIWNYTKLRENQERWLMCFLCVFSFGGGERFFSSTRRVSTKFLHSKISRVDLAFGSNPIIQIFLTNFPSHAGNSGSFTQKNPLTRVIEWDPILGGSNKQQMCGNFEEFPYKSALLGFVI